MAILNLTNTSVKIQFWMEQNSVKAYIGIWTDV